MIYYQDNNSKIICADVRQGLKSLPDESVHCCVTAPPIKENDKQIRMFI